MPVSSWMIRDRSFRNPKILRGRYENKDDVVKLDFTLGTEKLVHEIFLNICIKHGISSIKKLNYLNAFVEMLIRNSDWKSDDFIFSMKDILYCLRVALIQDSVQVRAAGLRAVRYVIKTEEDIICLNNLRYPYLISRSLDLILKTDNEKVLMSERIQALRLIRHILSIAPQHVTATVVQPLVAIAYRPTDEPDRLLKSCLAVLCELSVLNSNLFIECSGVTALLRNCNINPSGHISEVICGSLLYLLNKPTTRNLCGINFQYMAAAYTNLTTSGKMSYFREEETRLAWANITLLSVLRSWCGILYLCHPGDPLNPSILKTVLEILRLDHRNTKKAILDLLYELMRIPEPYWTDDPVIALESVDPCRYQDAFKINEGFIVTETKCIFPSLMKCRVNLEEVHLTLILYCLLEACLPDILVEVIVNSDAFLSIRSAILLGQFLHLLNKYLPSECYSSYPVLPSLVSYSIRGCSSQLIPEKTCTNRQQKSSTISPSSDSNIQLNCLNCRTDDVPPSANYDGSVFAKFPSIKLDDDALLVNNDANIACKYNIALDSSRRNSIDSATAATSKEFAKKNASKKPMTIEYECLFKEGEIPDNILNLNRADELPCKVKQQKALTATTLLSNLHNVLQKAPHPVSLFLSNLIRYLEIPISPHKVKTRKSFFVKWKINRSKKLNQMMLKECDILIKESGVLLVTENSQWKWDSIRAVLKVHGDASKKLNYPNFRTFIRRLINYYKPSSEEFSAQKIELENGTRMTAPTLIAYDVFDFLLSTDHVESSKLLNEFLQDLDSQLQQLNCKSVHDCLISPQNITTTLCQDYFLLIGRLTNSPESSTLLETTMILDRLQQLATSTNLDCYVKLIISSLSYVSNKITRKLLTSAMSSNYVSTRLYIVRFLHIMLRLNIPMEFAEWVLEQLTMLLHDENNTVRLSAVVALDEAADNKDYLNHIIKLRPTLLHLGDKGLLLLIRFLSIEEGFSYLQNANFIAPQLQRWETHFNVRYVQLLEEDLHDCLTLFQRCENGLYRHRTVGIKPMVKDVYVPAHLYGQLAQHERGFKILLEHENFHRFIQVVLNEEWNTENDIMELKAALWALGHVNTTVLGSHYLSERKIPEMIVKYAEKCPVYSVKATAFYILSVVATTIAGEATLHKTGWKCLKRRRYEDRSVLDVPEDYSYTIDKSYPTDNEDFMRKNRSTTQSRKVEYLRNDQYGDCYSFPDEKSDVLLNRKSATLPPKSSLQSVSHNRSLSECKADTCDEWSSSSSPSSVLNKMVSDAKSVTEENSTSSLYADGSTSGIGSSDSMHTKPPVNNMNERNQTLSPIPSSSSLATVIQNDQSVNMCHFFRRQSSLSFNRRLNAQNILASKTFRMLHPNRYQISSSCSSLSASATINLLTGQDCKQMSPLVRSKIPKYTHEPLTYDFEVTRIGKCSQEIEDANSDDTSTNSNETMDKNVACFQGICFPENLSLLFPNEASPRLKVPTKQPGESTAANDIDLSVDSDPESPRSPRRKIMPGSFRKRRHDKQGCLLCIMKDNNTTDRSARSRKTSTNSINRNRTETESSYGGGVGVESTESPVLQSWQLKPSGLGCTPSNMTEVTGSNIAVDNSPSADIDASRESSLMLETNSKSRSLMRKEVLRMVEQLANPVLYRTCKQGLLQLKQLCGDLFQDICLYSDICSLLSTINYREQARQLVQDLFLDAPFYELYEEPLNILNKTADLVNSELKMTTNKLIPSPTDKLPTVSTTASSSFISKTTEDNIEAFENGNTNHQLSIIAEIVADANSEGSTSNRTITCCEQPTNDKNKGLNENRLSAADEPAVSCQSQLSLPINNRQRQIPAKPKRRNLSNYDNNSCSTLSNNNNNNIHHHHNHHHSIRMSSSTPVHFSHANASFSNLSPVLVNQQQTNDSSNNIDNNGSILADKFKTSNSNTANIGDVNIVPNKKFESASAEKIVNESLLRSVASISYSEDSIPSAITTTACGNNRDQMNFHAKTINNSKKILPAFRQTAEVNNYRHRKFATSQPPDHNLLLNQTSYDKISSDLL